MLEKGKGNWKWKQNCNKLKFSGKTKEDLFCPVPHPQVLMKDIVTPVPQEEVKGVIRKCLEQAAQLNYAKITEYAKIEGN